MVKVDPAMQWCVDQRWAEPASHTPQFTFQLQRQKLRHRKAHNLLHLPRKQAQAGQAKQICWHPSHIATKCVQTSHSASTNWRRPGIRKSVAHTDMQERVGPTACSPNPCLPQSHALAYCTPSHAHQGIHAERTSEGSRYAQRGRGESRHRHGTLLQL